MVNAVYMTKFVNLALDFLAGRQKVKHCQFKYKVRVGAVGGTLTTLLYGTNTFQLQIQDLISHLGLNIHDPV